MGLTYLLDTNICIYIAKYKPMSVLKRFEQIEYSELAMSIITYGELLFGAIKSQHTAIAQHKLQELSNLIPPLPLTIDVCTYYASVRAILEKNGQIIGGNDLWIAAHALALDIILVTNNIKEFSRVPNLKLENWV